MNTIADSFFFQVMRMRKSIFRKTNLLLTEAGINLQMEQLPILVILQKRGTLSQRELSDITLRDKSSILRSVSALQKKKLLVVEQDSIDRRKNNIDLSPEGKRLATQIAEIMQKAEDDALSVFSDAERKTAYQTVKGYADKLEGI
ncbi:MarR family winged helix-turn-helix transcriptional regulator [Pedobacter sp. L105]|uniref:MarR family winged helix-turn-helix transcriptional regulator n=1 Tax=Pedobacter sp. L105 TaxID=1641871 RepID=UPI00131D2C54|nr:MarR family transcriptional regulator [Pedobacter sp. L105]